MVHRTRWCVDITYDYSLFSQNAASPVDNGREETGYRDRFVWCRWCDYCTTERDFAVLGLSFYSGKYAGV